MAIIGIGDIWKIFEWANGSKTKRDEIAHQRIVEWLDGVLADLGHLSELWAKIMEDVSLIEIDPRRLTNVEPELRRILSCQTGAAERLHGFYYAASVVLNGEKLHGNGQESFVRMLSVLILTRQSGRQLVDELMENQVRMRFLSSDNRVADLGSIRTAGEAIQREIAALQVLIATFKATGLRL